MPDMDGRECNETTWARETGWYPTIHLDGLHYVPGSTDSSDPSAIDRERRQSLGPRRREGRPSRLDGGVGGRKFRAAVLLV